MRRIGASIILLTTLASVQNPLVATAVEPAGGAGGAVVGGGVAPIPSEAIDPVDASSMVGVRPNQALTVNAYIGMVNGEPLFVENVLRPIDAELRREARLSRDLGDFRSKAKMTITDQLKVIIQDTLTVKAAKETLTEEDKKRVEAFRNITAKNMLTTHQGSAAKADQFLRAQGSSFNKDLDTACRHYMVWLYLNKVLYPKIIVTRKQILEDYQRNIQKYSIPQEIDMYCITLSVMKYLPKEADAAGKLRAIANPTEAQWKEARNLATLEAQRLIKDLKNGADFAMLAGDFSADSHAKDGGRWPHIQKGLLANKVLEAAAFALPANTIGEPVQYVDEANPKNNAVIIVKVGEITAARTISFEKAQGEIYDKLYDLQKTQLSNEYYAQLLAKAAIENQVDRMADTVLDAATVRYLSK